MADLGRHLNAIYTTPIEWLSWAQVAGGHLPTSVFELERMLVGGQ